MEKIELKPKYDYTIQEGQSGAIHNIRNHVHKYYLSDEMIEWMFENVSGKFFQDGHYLYFANGEDATAFKLRWI